MREFLPSLTHTSARDIEIRRKQLLDAARNGRTDEMLDLLGEGASIEFKDRVRDLDTFSRRMLAACVSIVKLFIIYFCLPLPPCIFNIYSLIGNGMMSRPHTIGTQSGRTALIRAANGGHTDCARLLLESGANVDAKSNVRSRK